MVIEKNIPPPKKEESWRSKLDALEVGESFSFPESKKNSVKNSISDYFHRLTKKRFTVSVKDQPAGTARVWRLEDREEEE